MRFQPRDSSKMPLFASTWSLGLLLFCACIPGQPSVPPSTTLLLGQADGSLLELPSQTLSGIAPGKLGGSAFVVGDFNGDGSLDLVAFEAPYLRVLLGDGKGGFRLLHDAVVKATIASAIAGDFDHDGHLDFEAVDALAGTVTFFRGAGDGRFVEGALLAVASGLSGLAVADFNGDGNADLVATGYFDGTLYVALGHGDGTFKVVATYERNRKVDSLPLAGDFDGDGHADVAVLVNDWSAPLGAFQDHLEVQRGQPDGTLGTPEAFAINSQWDDTTHPADFEVGDFNGDHQLDLLVVASNAFVVLLTGNGQGSFTASAPVSMPETVNGQGFSFPDLGDFNGDGKPDLLGESTVLIGQGNAHFTPGGSLASSTGYGQTVMGDFNADGRTDLLQLAPGYQGTGPSFGIEYGVPSY